MKSGPLPAYPGDIDLISLSLIEIYWLNTFYTPFNQLKAWMVSSSHTTILKYKITSSFDLFITAGTVAVYWFTGKTTSSMRPLFS